MSDVSLLLARIGSGKGTEGELYERVHSELRRLAASILRNSPSDPLLQPTALVNEAYLKLVGGQPVPWEGKAHFFHVAARAMRQVLVDYARQRKAAKRRGVRVDLSESLALSNRDPDLLLAIDEALDGLREIDDRCAHIVDLRFFAGLTLEESADLLQTSLRTVKRDWEFARVWLEGQLESPR